MSYFEQKDRILQNGGVYYVINYFYTDFFYPIKLLFSKPLFFNKDKWITRFSVSVPRNVLEDCTKLTTYKVVWL